MLQQAGAEVISNNSNKNLERRFKSISVVQRLNLIGMTHNSENFGIDLALTVTTAIVGPSVRRKCCNECRWQRFLLLNGFREK